MFRCSTRGNPPFICVVERREERRSKQLSFPQEAVTLLSQTSRVCPGCFFFYPIHSPNANTAANLERLPLVIQSAARTHVAYIRHLALTVCAAFSSLTSHCVATEQQLAAQHD